MIYKVSKVKNNQVRLHKRETERDSKLVRKLAMQQNILIVMPKMHISLTHDCHMAAPPTCTCWPAVSDILASSVASKSAMATYTSTGSNSSSFIDPGTLWGWIKRRGHVTTVITTQGKHYTISTAVIKSNGKVYYLISSRINQISYCLYDHSSNEKQMQEMVPNVCLPVACYLQK